MGDTTEVHHQSYERFITNGTAGLYAKQKYEGRINMKKSLNSLKYFAPLVQIALCPVTILFLWSMYTGPQAIPVDNKELVQKE